MEPKPGGRRNPRATASTACANGPIGALSDTITPTRLPSLMSGSGAVRAFTVGIAFLGEAMSATRILAAGLIVSGLVLMKLSSTA